MSESFKTLDSGKRVVFNSNMQRDSQEGKPRFDLIQPLGMPYEETFLYRIAMLMQRGAIKYSQRNWEQANSLEEFERFKASAWRHFMQAMSGDVSEDHFSGCFFNLNAIIYLMWKLKIDFNGKPIEEKK